MKLDNGMAGTESVGNVRYNVDRQEIMRQDRTRSKT